MLLTDINAAEVSMHLHDRAANGVKTDAIQ